MFDIIIPCSLVILGDFSEDSKEVSPKIVMIGEENLLNLRNTS